MVYLGSRVENGEDVVLVEEDVVVAVDLHVGAGVLADRAPVAGPDLERAKLAAVKPLPGTERDDV